MRALPLRLRPASRTMSSQEPTRPLYGETMHTRRITMPDGRYLIFYTFDDAGPEPSPAPSPETRPEADARPEMTEERDV
jgi:hypothetical protein